MSTEVQQPNGEVPSFKIVSKLDGVPVIHDSVAYADAILNSTGPTAYLYQTALSIASRSYSIATPIISRTKPILETADGLAVATFDKAEATFPYPFKTPTQDLIVVKQGKAVYDARIAPFIQQYQPVLHDVLSKTAQINSALGARAQATIETSKEYADHLVEQLKQIADKSGELPGQLIEGVQKASHDIREIVVQKDVTLQEKSNKIGAYVIDQVKPVVDEIYNYLLGAKKKVEEEADKVHGAPQ